jgi:vesicle-fusing ATPase
LPDEDGRVQIFQIHTTTMQEGAALGDIDLRVLAQRTRNCSGAEIEGLVKAATQFALMNRIESLGENVKTRDLGDLKVTMEHFEHALAEAHPQFGVEETQLKSYVRNGIIPFGLQLKRC